MKKQIDCHLSHHERKTFTKETITTKTINNYWLTYEELKTNIVIATRCIFKVFWLRIG